MRWSFRIGTVAGIRIELHVTFLLFLGWVALSSGLAAHSTTEGLFTLLGILLIFGCVLLHELGHAFAARRYGIATRSIVLLPIGGIARLERMPERPLEELVVAVAGPLVNVTIVAILWLIGVRTPPLASVVGFVIGRAPLAEPGLLETIRIVNVAMILFNMIPAFPMDGGRVLRALLAMRVSHRQATAFASRVGQVIAVGFALWGLQSHPMLLFIAMFVFFAAAEERALSESRSALNGVPVRAGTVTDFHALAVHDPLQRAVDHLMTGDQQEFPVMDGDRPVGMLGRAELVRALRQHGAAVPVGDVVPRLGDSADAGEPLENALQRMRERGRRALPVFQHGRMIGMLTLDNVGDLLVVRDALRRFAGA